METNAESMSQTEGDQILTEVKIEYSGIKLEPIFETTDALLSEHTSQSYYESKPEVSELFPASNNDYSNQLGNDLSYTVVKCEKDSENCDVDVVNTEDEANHGGIRSVDQDLNTVDNDNINATVLELCREISLNNGEDNSLANNIQDDEDLTNAINILHDAMMAETAPNMEAYTDHAGDDLRDGGKSADSDSFISDSAELEIDVDVSDSLVNRGQKNANLSMYDVLKSRVRVQNIKNSASEI